MSQFFGGLLGTNPKFSNTNVQSGQSGSSNTTGSSNQFGSTSNVSTSNPNLPSYYSNLLGNTAASIGQMQSQALRPVYGQQQIASYMNGLNQLTSGANSQLSQGLASRGALNSGALSSGLQGIQMNRLNNATNFMGQIPLMNQQAMNQNLSQANSLANNFKAPYGTTNTSFGTSQQFGNTASTTNSQQTGYNNSQNQSGQTGGLLGGLGSLLSGPLMNLLNSGLGQLINGGSNAGASIPPGTNVGPNLPGYTYGNNPTGSSESTISYPSSSSTVTYPSDPSSGGTSTPTNPTDPGSGDGPGGEPSAGGNLAISPNTYNTGAGSLNGMTQSNMSGIYNNPAMLSYLSGMYGRSNMRYQ
jgi:hypothetical protein